MVIFWQGYGVRLDKDNTYKNLPEQLFPLLLVVTLVSNSTII